MDFLQITSGICIQKIPFQRYLWRLSILPRSGGTNFSNDVHFPSQRTTSIYVFPKSKNYLPVTVFLDGKLLSRGILSEALNYFGFIPGFSDFLP